MKQIKQSRSELRNRHTYRVYDTEIKNYLPMGEFNLNSLIFKNVRTNFFTFDNLDNDTLITEQSLGRFDMEGNLLFEHDRVLFRGMESIIVWTPDRGFIIKVVADGHSGVTGFFDVDSEMDLRVVGTVHKKWKKPDDDE